ncbi:unnamed protein product [Trichogramma brassicae]|uniref:Uncharacterized protein n=1 Tax=Trichogramma brassicae TaxID=86971 RepID=A0A6H5IRW9_9HYME|nr:unnamed protein product [Trichogramma brassicae]
MSASNTHRPLRAITAFLAESVISFNFFTKITRYSRRDLPSCSHCDFVYCGMCIDTVRSKSTIRYTSK